MAAPSAPRPPRPRKEPQPLVIPRSAAEEQRLRLERLMRNPEKTVPIPEKLNEWAPRPPPEFVRDVMGKDSVLQITLVPVLGLGAGSSTCTGTSVGESTRGKISWMPWLRSQKLKEKKLQAKKNKLEQKKQEKEPGQSQEQGSSEDDEEDSKEEEEKEDDAEEPSFVMGRG
ncbi:PRKR-interacting protein 1 isoform X2 [Agelaius tricolor]|uniref:PRKR-interacting protein 1 isoform X2 n=1 Tax=Agelaius phoeniceus TaxID=39638 RepID=UPI0023ED3516|nr:PRKR-interacting protein 1 isoform X2 [Agelaius phoeniceus]